MNSWLPPALALVLSVLIVAPPAAPPALAQTDVLERAQGLIDEGNADGALELLDRFLRKNRKSATAYLLRSTARFIGGDRVGGQEDLKRALELDPKQRQGWLNMGALLLSKQDHDGALAAFERARELDPSASDNDLNLGTTLLLAGRLEQAAEHLAAYVARAGDRGEAAFLVAKNYALAGYQALAIEQLRGAIDHDERYRLDARTDNSFETLRRAADFRELLATDSYAPAPGSYSAARVFEQPYEASGRLLGAVIDSLQKLGVRFDPRVEVTASWALIWADMRVKVAARDHTSSTVEITAPPGAFSPAEWQRRTSALFERIRVELAPKLP